MSRENDRMLADLEEQDLIECRYPDKRPDDLDQEYMLTPLGIYEFQRGTFGYETLNPYRSRATRALVHQARGWLERTGFKTLPLEWDISNDYICAPDITAMDRGKRIYAFVESEEFSASDAIHRYRVFWRPDKRNLVANSMYVFCQNQPVLHKVMDLIMTRFDVKPPTIYLCNLEEAEQNMLNVRHPWTVVRFSERQRAYAKPEPEA